jgi:Uma2 family endonuclease
MATVSTPPLAWNPWGIPELPVRRFTVDEYHRMIADGYFADDERFELLEGWITPKMVRNPPHDAVITLLDEAIRPNLPPGWLLRIQSALTTVESEPEPDLAVVRGRPRDYSTRHPGPGDIALVVEVAESSLDRDRGVKRRIYARAGIPVYWLVNLATSRVEVYSEPTGPVSEGEPSYRRHDLADLAGDVALVIEGREVARFPASELLP